MVVRDFMCTRGSVTAEILPLYQFNGSKLREEESAKVDFDWDMETKYGPHL